MFELIYRLRLRRECTHLFQEHGKLSAQDKSSSQQNPSAVDPEVCLYFAPVPSCFIKLLFRLILQEYLGSAQCTVIAVLGLSTGSC